METAEMNSRLVKAIKNFFAERGKSKAVLGLSGGIDSALTLSLLVEALGKGNVAAVLMPNTAITQKRSTDDAENFARRLGVKYFIAPIDSVLEAFRKNVPWKQSPVAGANLNARARALALYSYANSFGALVAGTGNKSEFYLGYFTKYGDAAADFFPIGGLLKKEVLELAKFRGLPREFLEKTPSAELWVGQEDEKELGLSYAEIDVLLPLILEGRADKIPAAGKAAAEKIISRMKATEHKRKAPEIILF